MKIKITAPGIYNAAGEEIPLGSELTLKNEPIAWAGRYEVISGGEGDKTAVTNPAVEHRGPYKAREKSPGWFQVYDADDKEVGKAIRKDDADAFNALSDDEKAELLKAE